MLGFSMLTILTNKKAGLEVPHSRFKIGLSAKKIVDGDGDRLTQNEKWARLTQNPLDSESEKMQEPGGWVSSKAQ